jgi:hypothetical protein
MGLLGFGATPAAPDPLASKEGAFIGLILACSAAWSNTVAVTQRGPPPALAEGGPLYTSLRWMGAGGRCGVNR